jgi:hypothetical protein
MESKNSVILGLMIVFLVFLGFVSVFAENSNNSNCKNLYWFDNDNKSCGQKEFCGAYMYYGLQTFQSKTQCEKMLNLTGNESRNQTENQNKTFHLSNGRNAEIKIMPETASEKAIERLGDLGFNITLKEVSNKGNETVVYNVEGEKEGKILGFFKVKAKVSAEVNAETGEVIKVHKPWWAFLSTGI